MNNWTRNSFIKKVLVVLLVSFSSILFAGTDPGVINLIYTNYDKCDTTSTETGLNMTFLEFDVYAYLSDHSGDADVLYDGQIYVEYPVEVFGDSLLGKNNDNIVEIERKGMLAQEFSSMFGTDYYYTLSETAPTSVNAFSLAFTSQFNHESTNASSIKSSMMTISESSSEPTYLMTIKMQASSAGSGQVNFLESAQYNSVDETHTNTLYKDFEMNNYGGTDPEYDALDISQTYMDFTIDNIATNEVPTPVTFVNGKGEYNAGKIRLSWSTESETENAGFIVKRALAYDEHNGVYEKIGSYLENDELKGHGTTSKRNEYSFIDNRVEPGKQYAYLISDIDIAGSEERHDIIYVNVPDNKVMVGDDYEISTSYPNPFNPVFVVPFNLYRSKNISIKLYDVAGKLVKTVADGYFESGEYKLAVNGSDLSSGIYFLKTNISGRTNTQKMMLVK